MNSLISQIFIVRCIFIYIESLFKFFTGGIFPHKEANIQAAIATNSNIAKIIMYGQIIVCTSPSSTFQPSTLSRHLIILYCLFVLISIFHNIEISSYFSIYDQYERIVPLSGPSSNTFKCILMIPPFSRFQANAWPLIMA